MAQLLIDKRQTDNADSEKQAGKGCGTLQNKVQAAF